MIFFVVKAVCTVLAIFAPTFQVTTYPLIMLSACITRVKFVEYVFKVFKAAKINFFKIKFSLLFFAFLSKILSNFKN